jgi:hypothetical protein
MDNPISCSCGPRCLSLADKEAIAVGYGLRFPDDIENIERQFEVYDAFYAWCRLDVARDES